MKNKEIEFETLHSNKHRIYLLCGIVCVVVLMVTLIVTTSRAKYRVTESMPLIQGTINFSPSDLNLMAVYLNRNGETISSDKVPHVGYTLNQEQSICEVNDVKDETIEIVYENGLLNFNGLGNKGTKCTAYFDLIPDSENPVINNINGIYTDTSITVTVDASDNIGIYYYYFQIDGEDEIQLEENSYTFENLNAGQTYEINIRVEDAAGNTAEKSEEMTAGLKGGDVILASSNAPTRQTTDWTGGTSYYYTGNPNNWVQFGGFYWRIIRINGNGTIRMIYQGVADSETPDSGNITGTGTQLQLSAFNGSYNNKTNVGLVYNTSSQHGYGTNSTIMATLNNWYNSNIENDDNNLHYEQYIDTGVGFCSDRNIASGDNYTDSSFHYAAYDRRYGSASLQCDNEDILSQDNGKLPNPIGLVTSDAVLTGITYNGANIGSYLYTGQDYWTMTPRNFTASNGAYVFTVGEDGTLYYDRVFNTNGVRPVINLRNDVVLTGSGTVDDPFKIA